MAKFNSLRAACVTKRKLKKWAAGNKIGALMEESLLKKELETVLESGGRIYAYYDKKDMIAVFPLVKERAEIALPYVEAEELLKKEHGEKEKEKAAQTVCRLTHPLILPEYEEHAEKMKEYIQANLKEWAEFAGVAAIYWGEEIIRKKEVKLGGLGYFTGLTFGLSMGILFGIIFDNIGLGIAFGLCFACSGGLLWSTVKGE